MKISKSEARSSTRSIPELRFEDQALTSFSGLVVFQKLFERLKLRERLRACVRHLKSSSSYPQHVILLLLTVHLLLGWRRLRDLDYYRDDALVLRVLGLGRMPNVSTISRCLRGMDEKVFQRQMEMSQDLVCGRIAAEGLRKLTIDFDGSVLSTKSRNTEGTAIGYNKTAKGQRSYYPLFSTVAQTGQVFDVLFRPGNVHDSNGAGDFIETVVAKLRSRRYGGELETRMDSAHFNEATLFRLADAGIEFSVSVPFERFSELKAIVENWGNWNQIDDDWCFFELTWKPKKWDRWFRCIAYRQRKKKPRSGPIQLDFFEPLSHEYEYKVVMTNKEGSARAVLLFHNGRGSQEGIFSELKSQTQMDYLPTRRLAGNRVYLASAVLAHNLQRELQMETSPRFHLKNTLKRGALWLFEKVGTFRKRVIQRAGRLTRPGGVLTLTCSANEATAAEMTDILEALEAPCASAG